MCIPSVDTPKVEVEREDPKIAEEQISLANRVTEETRRRRLSAFNDSIATSSRGLLTTPSTTRSVATSGGGGL